MSIYRKGIVLAGGSGKRMSPASIATNKQLFPVYDKPMIYYPLSTLMLAGIKEALIITTPAEHDRIQQLLLNGQQWGISISYMVQEEPRGIADAFILADKFIGTDNVCLILGDNIFYGDALPSLLINASQQPSGATIFAYLVRDPSGYGIVNIDHQNVITSIEEKPTNPSSNYAVTGIYFYDNKVINYAKSLQPSARNELEITDINRIYLKNNQLSTRILGRGMAWLDAGTPKSMLDAANFIYALEERQGLKISCPEEIAWRLGNISDEQLYQLAKEMPSCDYSNYLFQLLANTFLKTPAYEIHSPNHELIS